MTSLRNNLLTVAIILCVHVDVTLQCENITAAPLPMTRLYNAIIAPHRYVTRPVLNPLNQTTVYLHANFMKLVDVNEISSTVTINLWLEVRWQDEIRCWNPADYDGIDSIQVISRDVWRPTLLAINSNDQRYLFESDDSSIYILSDGNSTWFPGQALSFACAMDLTQFPFDSQTCALNIITRDFDTEVELKNVGVGRYDLKETNSEWDVVGTSILPTGQVSTGIANRTFSSCDFTINIKRKAGFFLLNTILPVNLLTLLSLATFVIPDDSGEKISYSVTVLLSTGIYLSALSSTLPQSSDKLPLVMIYLFSLGVYCALAMLVTLATMTFRRKYANSNNNNNNKVEPVKDTGVGTIDHRSGLQPTENSGFRMDNRSDTISNQNNSGFNEEPQSCKAKPPKVASAEQVYIRKHSHTAAMVGNQLTRKPADIVSGQLRVSTAASHCRPSSPTPVGVKNRCPGLITLDVGIILVFLSVWVILTASFVYEMTK